MNNNEKLLATEEGLVIGTALRWALKQAEKRRDKTRRVMEHTARSVFWLKAKDIRRARYWWSRAAREIMGY